eukprot:524277_1
MSQCSHLLNEAILVNRSDLNTWDKYGSSFFNISNNSFGEIWLEENVTSIFDSEYWKRFDFYIILAILICIGIMIAKYMIYYHDPHFDKQQKLLQLRILSIEPILKKDVIPILDQFVNDQDVIEIILEFANITIKHENII